MIKMKTQISNWGIAYNFTIQLSERKSNQFHKRKYIKTKKQKLIKEGKSHTDINTREEIIM